MKEVLDKSRKENYLDPAAIAAMISGYLATTGAVIRVTLCSALDSS